MVMIPAKTLEMQAAEARDRVSEQRGLVRDLTTVLEKRNAVIKRLLVAGNHIATWRQPDWPKYKLDGLTREQQCEHALRTLGAGRDYDMWCCWSAMMQARDDLET